MNTYTATEQAYKNGYEAGVREFAERLREEQTTAISCNTFTEVVRQKDINTIANELIDKQRKEDEKNV